MLSLIGLLGTSSGGHQAILNALSPNHPNFFNAELKYQTVDSTVGHVIACWPELDPSARYEMVLNRGKPTENN